MMREKYLKSRFFSVLPILMFLIVLPSISYAKKKNEAPGWVKKGYHSRYPKELYMTGIGISSSTGNVEDDQNRADLNARAEIAKQIKVQVVERITDILKEESRRKGYKKSSDVSTEITTSTYIENISEVDLSLMGLTIAERWYDKKEKIYYSFAVLDRGKAGAKLKEEINSFEKLAKEYKNMALKSEDEKDYFGALKNYLMAKSKLEASLPIKAEYRVVQSKMGSAFDDQAAWQSPGDMELAIVQIFSGLRLVTISGDNQEGSWNNPLNESLVVKLIYNKDGKSISVKEFPLDISFQDGSGQLENKVKTDNDGLAVSKIFEVKATGKRNNIIQVNLDLDEIAEKNSLHKKWLIGLNKPSLDFNYYLPERSFLRIVVKIFEENLGKPAKFSEVEAVLIKSISQMDYTLLDQEDVLRGVDLNQLERLNTNFIFNNLAGKADLIIIGKASSKFSGEYERIIFARSTVDINILDIRNRKIVLKTNFKDKDGGNTREQAGRRSLIKLGKKTAKELVKEIGKLF